MNDDTISQYVVNIRNDAFCSLPPGQSAFKSSSVFTLNDATNQRRASRSRGSRRRSYSFRIKFTSSNVARSAHCFITSYSLLPTPYSLRPTPYALLLLDHSHIGHRVALLQRRHRADVGDDARVRRADFLDDSADEIGDVADFHSFLDVGAPLDGGIEDAAALGADVQNFLDPDRLLD